MSDFLHRVRGRLAREKSVSDLVRNNARFALEVARAQVGLRACDEVGAWTRAVGGQPTVSNRGHIRIGERTRLYCSFAPVELRVAPGGTLRIGEGASINFGTLFDVSKSVQLGKNVSIGPYSIVSDTEVASSESAGAVEASPIEIGDDVWLASRVTVLPGARIGDGSVITAGSVVSGEVPPGVVAGGIPARVLRKLGAQESAEVVAQSLEQGASAGAAPAPPEQTTLAPAEQRGYLISDFTIDELARTFDRDPGQPRLAAEVAPFGQVIPVLMSPPPEGVDFAVLWTRPEGAIPAFARLLEYQVVEDAALLADVDSFAALVREGLKAYRYGVVPTWTCAPWQRGLGMVDGRPGGVTRALHMMNARLMEQLASAPNVFVLNAERWLLAAKGGYSAKLWYMGKVPFVPAVFEQAAADIRAVANGLKGGAKKLLVLDLDDTLWGGVVGDIGWEQLRLGGHDSLGESFVDFQTAIKHLKRRGILLGLVSKNEESVALEAIRKHPAMVLREEDFVAHRINWQDKAQNIADLTASLNLGLQSVVFLDDNPFERARVRETLPEVYVPEWPEDKLLYTSALAALTCFDAPALSAEDLARGEMYNSEKQREALKTQLGSLDEWLKSLGIRVRVETLKPENLARTTQLLNKTNQMNLTTRRLTEPELSEWVRAPNRWLWAISVSDRLGDAGLTGIVSMEEQDGVARIVDFVLSCRVMGRRIEETMVHLAVDAARRHGHRQVVAQVIPTAKNKPCQTFWRGSQFRQEGELTFVWDAEQAYLLPAAITLDLAG